MPKLLITIIQSFPITIVIFISLAGILEPDRKSSSTENRKLKTIDDINFKISNLTNLPKEIDSYFKDQSFMKDAFYGFHTRYKLMIGDSPSEDVTIGKQNWFFLGSPLSKKYPNLINLPQQPLPPAKSVAYINQKLGFKRFLNSKGIEYLLVIAPDKSTIYPEYLPNIYYQFQGKKAILSENISSKFSRALGVNFIYLKDPLLKAKKVSKHPLYYLWDTHWNQIGASVAEASIARRIASILPSLDLNLKNYELNLKARNSYEGDLAIFAGARYLREDVLNISPTNDVEPDCRENNISSNRITCVSDADSLKVLLIGDSFSIDLIPYISRRYNKVVAIREYPSRSRLEKLVRKVNPDFVIEQVVEREFRSFYQGLYAFQ